MTCLIHCYTLFSVVLKKKIIIIIKKIKKDLGQHLLWFELKEASLAKVTELSVYFSVISSVIVCHLNQKKMT